MNAPKEEQLSETGWSLDADPPESVSNEPINIRLGIEESSSGSVTLPGHSQSHSHSQSSYSGTTSSSIIGGSGGHGSTLFQHHSSFSGRPSLTSSNNKLSQSLSSASQSNASSMNNINSASGANISSLNNATVHLANHINNNNNNNMSNTSSNQLINFNNISSDQVEFNRKANSNNNKMIL